MGDSNLVVTTAGSVVMSSVFLQYLKSAGWFPWLTKETERANRIAAIVLAGIASIGIHFKFDQQAGQLLITGLTWDIIRHDAWQWFVQFAIQHGFYKTAVVPVELMVKNSQLQQEILNYLKQVHLGDTQPPKAA